MPPNTPAAEIAGNAAPVKHFTLTPPRYDRLRVYGAGKTVTVTNIGPGTIRHATVANDGAFGTWADVASGASLTVAATETRDLALLGPGVANLQFTY